MERNGTERKPRLVRRIALTLSIVLSAVVLLTAVSCSASLAAPEQLFEDAPDKTFAKIADWKLPRVLAKVMNGGSVSVTCDTGEIGKNVFTLFLDGDKAAFTADMKKSKLIDSPLTATAFIDDEKVLVKSKEVLNGAYGLTFKGADRRLGNSVFAPGSGSEYEMMQAEYDLLCSALKALETAADSRDDLKKAYEEAGDVFIGSIRDNAAFTKDKTETTVFGKTVGAVLVTAEFDGGVLCGALEDTLDYLKTNDDFMDFIEAAEEPAAVFFGVFDLTQAEDAVKYLRSELKDVDFTLELYFNVRQSTLMRVDFEVTVGRGTDKQRASVSVELGETLKTFEGLRVTWNDSAMSTPLVVEVNVTDTEARTVIELTGSEELGLSGSLHLNKKNGRLELTFDADGEGFTLEGMYTVKRGVHTLEVTRLETTAKEFNYLTYGYETVTTAVLDGDTDALTITVKERDRMPGAGKFTDILTLTDEDIRKIRESAESFFKP